MMATSDLYAVLGVLPNAEDVVIKAAYRALCHRYHPDLWSGDPAVAHKRMTRINDAYSTLGDPTSRAKYDETQVTNEQADFGSSDANDFSEEFSSALFEVEQRWSLACGVFPDLADLRARLDQISTALAFSFVTVLLETRTFPSRSEIAARLEGNFLRRYFGTNMEVLAYARKLVFYGQRDAARKLNRLVDVLGSEAPAQLLIEQVDKEFNLQAIWAQQLLAIQHTAKLDRLKTKVKNYHDFQSTTGLIYALGYSMEERSLGLFKGTEILLTSPLNETFRFDSIAAFRSWVEGNLCT